VDKTGRGRGGIRTSFSGGPILSRMDSCSICAASCPPNIVPGIGFSPDEMPQGRLFFYGDAQRYRPGVNHHLIPVNAPRCPVNSFHRDGATRVDGNAGSTLGFVPRQHRSRDGLLCCLGTGIFSATSAMSASELLNRSCECHPLRSLREELLCYPAPELPKESLLPSE
jgi:hypothetical protein